MALALHAWLPTTVLRLCVLAGLSLVAACYSPSLRDCAVACAAATDCGGGQICGSDGFCSSPEVAGHCDTSPDAGPANDGAQPATDAPTDDSLCALGCSAGTCVAGVCVIDCSAADSCPDVVTCPANLPCRVVCGDRACSNKIECRLASSCDVQCTGTDSCSEEVSCGAAACTVACAGAGSCHKKIKCKETCACDVTCSGLGACREPAECPLADTCRLGNGCTSTFPTCDRCA